MGKHSIVSGIIVFAVFLMVAITTFMVLNYTSGVLTAAVAFASTDQIAKLQACGITIPPELFKLQSDIPSFLLPAVYVGFPGLMIIISILMFTAGYYYGNGREEHSSSETTTKTSSPDRSGRHVEETRTQKSSRSDVD